MRLRVRETSLRSVALGAIVAVAALAAGGSVSTASAQPRPPEARPVRTIQVAVSPENARVAVDGQPREARNGVLELRGPLGAVFTIEAMANGARVVERVAVTDIGALPSQIAVPQAPPGFSTVVGECAFPFFYDAKGVKHYRTQCFPPTELETAPPPSAPPAQGRASLTVICTPRCDAVVDNGIALGPGHVMQRPILPGRHVLELSAPNGVRKTITTDVVPDTAKEVRVTMEPEPARPVVPVVPVVPIAPAAPGPTRANDPGFLSLVAYPWANVSEGAKQICVTPCVKTAMSPGAHTLVLENAERGTRRTVIVTIKSGETTAKSIALE